MSVAVKQVDVYDLAGMSLAPLDKDYPNCRYASCPACSCDGIECRADSLAESAPHLVIEYQYHCPQLYHRAQKLMGRTDDGETADSEGQYQPDGTPGQIAL